jgi:hypothetical protein
VSTTRVAIIGTAETGRPLVDRLLGAGRFVPKEVVVARGLAVAHGRSHALNIRWDAEADRFWVARVSANTWTWVRTGEGWRIAERLNANLDGTADHREMLAPRP